MIKLHPLMTVAGVVLLLASSPRVDPAVAGEVGSQASGCNYLLGSGWCGFPSLNLFNLPKECPLQFGADTRFRLEDFPGAIALDPHVDAPVSTWLRIRSRFWMEYKANDQLLFKMRLVNETRPILSPQDYHPTNPNDRYDEYDETIFDNFYMQLTLDCPTPLRLRVGRQDMLALPGMSGPNGDGFGDGLIFMDGTPGDGSRSFFFDAIRATFDLSACGMDSSLDVLAIDNRRYADTHGLPIFGPDAYRRLDQWDNQLYGLYYKNAGLLPQAQLDLYYLYKLEAEGQLEPWENYSAYSTPGSYFSTYGARLDQKLCEDVQLSLEGAYQQGAWNEGAGRHGWATEEQLKWSGKCKSKPSLKLFHAYLSGDDPDTPESEGWRQVYGAWPKWGELIGYMRGREEGVYYLNNMHIFGVEFITHPCEEITLMLCPAYLLADQNTFGPGPYARPPFGTGKQRGFYPRTQITWAPTKKFSASVLFEYLEAGNYYQGTSEAHYYFTQLQFQYKF